VFGKPFDKVTAVAGTKVSTKPFVRTEQSSHTRRDKIDTIMTFLKKLYFCISGTNSPEQNSC